MRKKVLLFIGIIIVIIAIYIIYKVNDNYNYGDYYDYLDNISYDISNKFKESEYSGGYYHYYGNNVSCTFDVDSFSTYNYFNGSDYIKDRITFTLNDKVSDIKEVDLNGYKWFYFGVDGGNNKEYYYATIKDDKGYLLKYEISDYLRGDSNKDRDSFCYTEYDKIISSVRFK